ncbi:hypothetical protein [Streptomyces sp. NPDC003247]|uniref:hypothetical protein n=1 Tax=Streptomyces sp. NPDC003247 TaxID=3364677 RepID=UPI0036832719
MEDGRQSDLDAVGEELYGLPPSGFTAARDEKARAARAAGDRELADRIGRLRKPTLAAWAGNLLVREEPDEVQRLLQLGEALRRAHQHLDAGNLSELSAQQHRLTFALSRQAVRLAARAGQRVGDVVRQEVQDTLHAVLADPDAAARWATGRLARHFPAPAGFPTAQPAGRAAPRSGRPAEASNQAKPDRAEAEARRRERQERIARARKQIEEAEQALQARERELAAAEKDHSRAVEEQRQAERQVNDLSRQLREAEAGGRRAQETAGQAHDRVGDAGRAVRETRRQARDAATLLRKLEEAPPETV